MDWFEKHFSLFAAPDLLLHVGAGAGADLDGYARLAGTRLVLVEPQPRLAAQLRNRATDLPNAEVLECAVGPTSGRAQLNLFNLPLLSSLQQPTGLRALLPGLAQTGQVEVEVCTLDELAEMLDLEPQADNWLVIDAPGVEADLVDALLATDAAPVFSQVFLRAGAEPLYEAGEPAAALAAMLRDAGFEMLGAPNEQDPDWPCTHLVFDERTVQVRELNAALDALKKRSMELAQARSDLESRLEQQRKDFEDRVTELDEQLREVTDKAERRLADLAVELEQGKRSLDESKRLQEQRIRELSQSLETKEQESARLAEERQTHADRVTELEGALKAAAHKAEDLARTLEAKERETTELLEMRQRLESELDQARADLSVALRVQSLRDADLKELQGRYSELVALKNRQHELLVQLGQRLGAASEYLQALKAPDGATDPSGATEGLVRALAGDLAPDR